MNFSGSEVTLLEINRPSPEIFYFCKAALRYRLTPVFEFDIDILLISHLFERSLALVHALRCCLHEVVTGILQA